MEGAAEAVALDPASSEVRAEVGARLVERRKRARARAKQDDVLAKVVNRLDLARRQVRAEGDDEPAARVRGEREAGSHAEKSIGRRCSDKPVRGPPDSGQGGEHAGVALAVLVAARGPSGVASGASSSPGRGPSGRRVGRAGATAVASPCASFHGPSLASVAAASDGEGRRRIDERRRVARRTAKPARGRGQRRPSRTSPAEATPPSSK